MSTGIFVGLSTIDIIYPLPTFPSENTKVVAGGQQTAVGGPAANACIAFAHFLKSALLVSGVGSHPLRNLIVSELDSLSISLIDLNPDFSDVPPISSIIISANGARTVISANATRLAIPDSAPSHELLNAARMVFTDGHFMQAGIVWAKAAKQRGIPVVMDGGSWKDGLDKLLPYVNVAICSSDFRPPNCRTDADTIQTLQSFGVGKIAITHGEMPIQYVQDQELGVVPVPAVRVVDTLGAGDIFHGAFCAHYVEQPDFIPALEFAASVASESVKYKGPREWMRHVSQHACIASNGGATVATFTRGKTVVPVATSENAIPAIVEVPAVTISTNNAQHTLSDQQIELAGKQIAKPEEQIDWGRRGTAVGLAALIATLGFDGWQLAFVKGEREERHEQLRQEEADRRRSRSVEVLHHYFLPLQGLHQLDSDGARVCLIAGIDDRYDPISPRKFSQSGMKVSSEYIDAFSESFNQQIVRVVDDLGEITDRDGLLLIASQEVNPEARKYFGEPSRHRPQHTIRPTRKGIPQYQLDLTWAIYTPQDAGDVTILQSREGVNQPVQRRTKEHLISCSSGRTISAQRGTLGGKDVWLNDYLLITAIPRDATERQLVVSLAGLHRTGTLAAGNLFSELPVDFFLELHRELGGHRYFQVLLPLEVDNSRAGEGKAAPGKFGKPQIVPLTMQKPK